VTNAEFLVMDALRMDFPDDSFDYVWACESGEHMPDKLKYVEEMTRVLKPGGRVVVATWCQREEGGRPFSKSVRYDHCAFSRLLHMGDFLKLQYFLLLC
jgi:MPBQ/MSBQ methyltransferase